MEAIKGYIGSYIFIAICFCIAFPMAMGLDWIGCGATHASLETAGALVAVLCGISCLICYLGLNNQYYLVIGMGFFLTGGSDLIHGGLSFYSFYSNKAPWVMVLSNRFFVVGRIVLATMIFSAPFFDDSPIKKGNTQQCRFRVYPFCFGVIVTAFVFVWMLPGSFILYQETRLLMPVDVLTAMLFCMALYVMLKRFIARKDTFTGMLIVSILFALWGQVYLAVSKHPFGACAEIAHAAKFFSYLMPLAGITMIGLEEMAKATNEVRHRIIIEKELTRYRGQLEKTVSERTSELINMNDELIGEIERRKLTEEELSQEVDQRKSAETKLSALVAELEQKNRDLEDFSYIVSHDLKAPLRGIRQLADWLYEDYEQVLDNEGKGHLKSMQDRTERMHNLINGILSYSRASREDTSPERFESLEMVRTIIRDMQIPKSVKVMISPDLPAVTYDKTHFTQVVQNLVENSVKHMGKQDGTIQIRSTPGDTWIEFCVSDNGVGIEEKHVGEIFKLFQSFNPGAETDSTGIGLSLIRKIVERNGGQVRVISDPGKETTFYFTIPEIKGALRSG